MLVEESEASACERLAASLLGEDAVVGAVELNVSTTKSDQCAEPQEPLRELAPAERSAVPGHLETVLPSRRALVGPLRVEKGQPAPAWDGSGKGPLVLGGLGGRADGPDRLPDGDHPVLRRGGGVVLGQQDIGDQVDRQVLDVVVVGEDADPDIFAERPLKGTVAQHDGSVGRLVGSGDDQLVGVRHLAHLSGSPVDGGETSADASTNLAMVSFRELRGRTRVKRPTQGEWRGLLLGT